MGSNSKIIKFLSDVGLILTISKITVIKAYIKSRDSSVGIATGYGLVGCGLILGRGQKFFSTHTA
jgi:hypothetical protein